MDDNWDDTSHVGIGHDALFLAYITHDILFQRTSSHTVLVLGLTLPLSLLSLHGLTQYMDDNWDDTSHVGTRHDALTNHGYNSALVKNVK